CVYFQVEAGRREFHVPGVQTCALPIFRGSQLRAAREAAALTATGSAPVARKSMAQPCQAAPISAPDRLEAAMTQQAAPAPNIRVAMVAPRKCSITPCTAAVLDQRIAARPS